MLALTLKIGDRVEITSRTGEKLLVYLSRFKSDGSAVIAFDGAKEDFDILRGRYIDKREAVNGE